METVIPGTIASAWANPQPKTYAAKNSPKLRNCGRCDQTDIIGSSCLAKKGWGLPVLDVALLLDVWAGKLIPAP
ncbi:hypothetical protein MesoLjLc_07230 [Mesorhizobium sp. L-8-10]|nr:hypothetical protein MesoLjLc_07230 [Mesorhizobium sp. L-8-10]